MSQAYTFRNKEGIYFTSDTIVFWIDLFTRNELKEIIVSSLKHCQRDKGLLIHGWCLMPSHLHMLISSDKNDLSAIMRDFKKYTAKSMVEWIKNSNTESRKEWLIDKFLFAGKGLKRISEYKVWQDSSHPIECSRLGNMIPQKLNYIHQNPVLSGIVAEAPHYLYSSAIDYHGNKGLIDISFV